MSFIRNLEKNSPLKVNFNTSGNAARLRPLKGTFLILIVFNFLVHLSECYYWTDIYFVQIDNFCRRKSFENASSCLDIEYRNVETGDLYPVEWCRNINIIHSTMASSSNILISIMETCISMGNESIKRKWPENNFHRNINDDLCSLGSKHIAYLFLFLVKVFFLLILNFLTLRFAQMKTSIWN